MVKPVLKLLHYLWVYDEIPLSIRQICWNIMVSDWLCGKTESLPTSHPWPWVYTVQKIPEMFQLNQETPPVIQDIRKTYTHIAWNANRWRKVMKTCSQGLSVYCSSEFPSSLIYKHPSTQCLKILLIFWQACGPMKTTCSHIINS